MKPPSAHPVKPGRLALGLCFCFGLAGLSAGCEQESEVRIYTARIDPPPPPPIQNPNQTPSGSAVTPPAATTQTNLPATPIEITWELPTDLGWQETGEANQFRHTTFRAGDPEDPNSALEVAVSRLDGSAGTITGNVNRWRGQLGLAPVDQREVVPLVNYAVNDHVNGERWFTRLESLDGSSATMVAWFVLDNAGWFFKANGTPAALDAHREGFDRLIASVKMADADEPPQTDRSSQPAEPAQTAEPVGNTPAPPLY